MSPNLVIIQLLHTATNHDEFLRLYWDKLTRSQKKDIFYFLYNAEQYKTFLTILRHELNSGSEFIPWTHTLSILKKFKLVNAETVLPFLDLAEANDEYGVFRVNIPQLSELWDQKKHLALKNYLEKKEELMGTLRFARQQGLHQQRVNIIRELKSLFPDDETIIEAVEEEREFTARQTLAKVSARRTISLNIDINESEMNAKERAQLLEKAKSYISKTPHLAIDLAIMFYQMELYQESLVIFEQITNKSLKVLWYELQVCIEAKQFARALSTIERIKAHEKLAADHSFSLLYYQAVSLYGLGQKAEAIHLLKQIIKIRSHFKSASSLLLEWESDQ